MSPTASPPPRHPVRLLAPVLVLLGLLLLLCGLLLGWTLLLGGLSSEGNRPPPPATQTNAPPHR